MTIAGADSDLRPVPMTREQYDILIAAGALDDQRVELIEGFIVEMAPQLPIHSDPVRRISNELVSLLRESFGRRYLVGVGLPLSIGPGSEPEPDISVVDASADSDEVHPVTAHLVVEVSRSSLRKDLMVKPRVYAGAGIPRYWVLDVAAREVVVHTDPDRGVGAVGRDAGYRTIRRVPLTTELELLGLTVRLADII